MQRLARHILCAMLVTLAACSSGAAEPITPVLLTTFTNPTPAFGEHFARSVAAVGSNRVVIGARGENLGGSSSGAAYLYRVDGLLLATLTNPTPANFDYFGDVVSGLGDDRILVGAFRDDTGATDTGAAYLFNTNGALLATFTNPFPAASDYFGIALAEVGKGWIAIGAWHGNGGVPDAGAVYLFDTNGAFLLSLTNPTPSGSDNFGYSIAALGDDRVIVGDYGDNSGADFAGAAYVFKTNGILLTTITNPFPVADWQAPVC
jgi:hypothetical protein